MTNYQSKHKGGGTRFRGETVGKQHFGLVCKRVLFVHLRLGPVPSPSNLHVIWLFLGLSVDQKVKRNLVRPYELLSCKKTITTRLQNLKDLKAIETQEQNLLALFMTGLVSCNSNLLPTQLREIFESGLNLLLSRKY